MNEIIINDTKGEATVSSVQVATDFGKQHKHVLEKISDIMAEMNSAEKSAQYFIESTYIDNSGKSNKCYELTRDGFSLLVMGFTGKKALDWKLKYIEAFNKMENQLKNVSMKALPTTYKEALIQLLEQVEENERLVEENQILIPKAEYHDEVLHKAGLITTTTIAKDLGMSGKKLNAILYLNSIIHKQGKSWKPFSKYEWLISDGYADYQSYTNENADPQLKWTEKGRKWIIEHINDWKAAC